MLRLTGFFLACLLPPCLGSGQDPIHFNRDIRPILSENCFHCHGPDEAAREAGLRLDMKETADYVVEPGDAESSELFARITSSDPDMVMPPPSSERSLTPDQIGTVRQWIDEGAEYQAHWSFVPPRPVAPPDPLNRDVSSSSIDRFIDQKLHQHQLPVSAPADRETLIRRAFFDLTGLPPSPREIDCFLTDDSVDAYERVLDRLLSSERFGERMASDWLDAARYSDTYGYQVDRDRRVWPWRDWVVDAFNDNKPYDQFLTEQIAGDLLPDASREQILATAFNRLHPQKVEGGSVPEEFRTEYVADRTQTLATAAMGLTFECCRCHDHKYDPLTQKNYYELSAFFDNIDEAGLYSFFTSSVPTPTLDLPTKSQKRELAEREGELRKAEAELQRVRQTRKRSARNWALKRAHEDSSSAREITVASPILSMDFEQPPEGPHRQVSGARGNGVQLTGDDGINTKVGNFRRSQPFSVALWIKTPDVKQRAVVFHRSRAWTDAGSRGYQLLIEDGHLSWSLIHFWPGNAIRIRTQDPLPLNRWVHVAVTNDGSSRADGLSIFVDGRPAESHVVRDRLSKPITGGGGDTITIGQRFRDRGFQDGSVDELRVFDCELSALEVALLAGPADGSLKKVASSRLPAELPISMLAAHHLKRGDPEVASARRSLSAARKRLCAVQDQIEEIMVMRETSAQRPTFLLQRGQYDQPGSPVSPDTPEVMIPFPGDAPRNRLGLARWLTDPEHPLTSRVAINRLWQLCFGNGLVRTPEDFGSQGSPPTHPELLDWLAIDFMRHDWDVKRMLKQIMMSRAYRRSSVPADPTIVRRDPTNRWLARFPSYRLPAEMLRDNALFVGGRLVDKMGGPPVKPYELSASFKPSEPDTGASLYRRSLYTYWKRTAPAPAMLTLDAPKRDVCRVKRERTSSPLQAFVLMNGPQYVEAARGLAERLLRDHPRDTDSMLAGLYRWLTSRQPSAAELQVLRDLHEEQLEYFRKRPESVDDYLRIGEAPPAEDIEPVRAAAASVVASTLMSFDLCVMKR